MNTLRAATLSLSSVVFLGLSSTAQAEVVLSYSPWAPGFVPEQVVQAFFDDVETATEGRVRVETRAAMVGGGSAAQFDVALDGLTDITMIVPAYTPGRFPLLEVGDFPFINTDHAAAADRFYKDYEQYLAPHNPFEGVKLLSIWLMPAQNVVTNGKVISSVDDFNGLKLRSPNPQSSTIMQSLGAVPVSAGGDQLFQMASTGMVQGAFFSYQAMLSFEIHPYLNQFTVIPGGLTSGTNGLVINQEAWGRIDPADQKIIEGLAGENLSARISETWAQLELDSRKKLEGLGVTFTDMKPELVEAI
jgi:TRAP-type C4-dicarboxylate transport system substrate-binding protein